MSKLNFELPLILTAKGPVTPEPDPIDPGIGTGAGGYTPTSYQSWLTVYGDNLASRDQSTSVEAYYQWWIANGFTEAEWNAANGPGLPWPDYAGRH